MAIASVVWVGMISAGGPPARGEPPEEPTLLVERVIPNKILYSLNENASAQVWLKNNSARAESGTLVATEVRGLNDSREVARLDVSLPPKSERKDISISWNVGPWMYGREIRLDFVRDGKVVSSASEFYQVADDWLRVNIIAGWKPDPTGPKDLGNFETYVNHGMQFAWAPDDFGDMTPDLDGWYSGQALYGPFNLDAFKARIKGRQSKGIKMSTYAKFEFCGPSGFEFARQHPEWVVRKKNGSFHTGYKALSPLDLAQPITHKQPDWEPGIVDFYEPEAVKYGAREIIASAKMFGWDGAMFDGHFAVFPGYSWDGKPTPHGKNPNELSARNVRLCREIIRKELPNFALWYNGVDNQVVKQPFDSIWGNGGGPETQEAALEDPNSGHLVEVQGPGFIQKTWRYWYDFYAQRRDETVQRFGTVMNSGWLWNYDLSRSLTPEEIKASRQAWAAASHMGAIFLAFQVHPCWNTTYASRPFTQFMTRYSNFLWARDIKAIKNPEEIITVKSSRPLWWKKSVYLRETSGGAEYLIHLLNSPTTKKPDWKVVGDPPAASNVEVTLMLQKGSSEAKAWALRPYEWREAPRRPWQVELEVEKTEEGAVVRVPSFHYYTLVVFRIEK